MKILLVVHKYPPFSTGGTEVYTRNLAQELDRRGWEVLVYFRSDEGQEPFAVQSGTVDGIRTRRISASLTGWRAFPLIEFYRTFLNQAVERDMEQVLAEERPDVVHFQHVMTLSARLIPLVRRVGIPSVLTLHDYWFICSNSQLIWPDRRICRGKAWGINCARCGMARLQIPLKQTLYPAAAPLFRLRDAIVRRAAVAADQIVAPSRFLIQQYIQAGFPPERLMLLENGLDIDRIRRHPRRPSPDGRLRFTFLGSLAWQKGVHVPVEAFLGLPADAAVLRIYGDPTIFPDYASYLQDMANAENTSFEGLMANEQIGRVFAETDAVIVPSLWYENSPVVIQEAFAAGVPVIASDIGALPEKVGSAGWLFPPGDVAALRSLIERIVADGAIDPPGAPVPPKSIAQAVDELIKVYHRSSHSTVGSRQEKGRYE